MGDFAKVSAYDFTPEATIVDGSPQPLAEINSLRTTVYKLQEAFNNVELPDENVYKTAILQALGK